MKKYISELLGTFFITLVGVGSLLSINFMVSAMGMMLPYGFSAFLSATAFAVTTGLMYYIFSSISGGHFNPAISLAVFIEDGVKKVKDLLLYIVFQILGAAFALGLLVFITAQRGNIGQVGYGELSPLYMGVIPAILVEIVLTILLVLIFLVGRKKKEENKANEGGIAIAIGASVFSCYSFGILATGGGLNPAKILVAGLISGGTALQQLPIFVILPFIGGIFAFLIFKGLFKENIKEITVNQEQETEEIEEITENTTEDTNPSGQASDNELESDCEILEPEQMQAKLDAEILETEKEENKEEQ